MLRRKPLIIYPAGPKISSKVGVDKEYLPKSKSIKEQYAAGDLVAKTYYVCPICPYQIQNKAFVITHGYRDHLNVKLGCCFCKYQSDAPKSLEKYFATAHRPQFTKSGLSEEDVKDVMDTIVSYEQSEGVEMEEL